MADDLTNRLRMTPEMYFGLKRECEVLAHAISEKSQQARELVDGEPLFWNSAWQAMQMDISMLERQLRDAEYRLSRAVIVSEDELIGRHFTSSRTRAAEGPTPGDDRSEESSSAQPESRFEVGEIVANRTSSEWYFRVQARTARRLGPDLVVEPSSTGTLTACSEGFTIDPYSSESELLLFGKWEAFVEELARKGWKILPARGQHWFSRRVCRPWGKRATFA